MLCILQLCTLSYGRDIKESQTRNSLGICVLWWHLVHSLKRMYDSVHPIKTTSHEESAHVYTICGKSKRRHKDRSSR